jgi:hypothetical protein
MDLLKKNVERLEKYRLNLSSSSKLNEMKQQGIDKLEALKDRIFHRLNLFFLRMQSQWQRLFDENHELSLQKDKMVRELNQIIKMFLRAKQNHTSLEGQSSKSSVKYQDLKDLLVLSSLLGSKSKIDAKVTGFLKKLDNNLKNKQ